MTMLEDLRRLLQAKAMVEALEYGEQRREAFRVASTLALSFVRTHAEQIERDAMDAAKWRKLMQWHDAPVGMNRATVVFWSDEPHEPSSALELAQWMDATMSKEGE